MESITKVSPIKEIGGKNTLLIIVNKRRMYNPQVYHLKIKRDSSPEETISLSAPKSNYNNFQEVYDDFKLRISKYLKNDVKNISTLYSEIYRYRAISILSAQLGLKISYQDRGKYKQFVDSFIEKYWINYQNSISDNWTNVYPKNFSDPGGSIATPQGKDMSVYIQIGDENWEKIRISDHAIMSNRTSTVMGIISKNTFEKLLFKKDGNMLDFINEVKKEYNDFIKNGINDGASIKKIANTVVQYENDIKKFVSGDIFLNKQDAVDIKDILDKIIYSYGNSASVIKNLSDGERKKLISVVNHQILKIKTDKYMNHNRILPTQRIKVSIDDVNSQSKQTELFDINKTINNFI